FPDGKDFREVAGAIVVRTKVDVGDGQHVIQTRADDPQYDGPEADVVHFFGLAAACRPALAAQPEGQNASENDAQRVDVNLDWTDFKAIGRWWRDGCHQGCKLHSARCPSGGLWR